MKNLQGKRVAVIVTHGFEQSEFEKPTQALKEAGAETVIISIQKGKIKSWSKGNWSDEVMAEKAISEVKAADFDAMVLPGGVMNPDKLRMNPDVVKFAKAMLEEFKPIAAICHGPWTLIETGLLNGRKMTSYPSLKTDLENAGVKWFDEEVVVDRGLVTSRKPDDLPAFCDKMIEEISEGPHLNRKEKKYATEDSTV